MKKTAPVVSSLAAKQLLTKRPAELNKASVLETEVSPTIKPKVPRRIEDSIWARSWVFHPESVPHMLWDLMSLLCIMYQAISVPYCLGFVVPITGPFAILDFSITIFFLSDISEAYAVVTFNTGYYSFGTLVMTRQLIFKNYIRSWLLIDLSASFPLAWTIDGPFAENEDSSGTSYMAPRLLRLFKVLRFLRILKLLRLAKLSRIVTNFEDLVSSDTISNFLAYLRLLTGVFFLAHWTACFWAYLAGVYPIDDAVTWNSTAYIGNRKDPFDQYVAALYWAFMTMTTTGYGDIVPVTMNEKIFSMLTMLLACGVFAYTIGSVTSSITKQAEEEDSFRVSAAKVAMFMKKKGVPETLQLKVKRYLEYARDSSAKDNITQGNHLINMLSEPLKDQLYSQLHAKALKDCRVFEIFQPEFTAGITKLITMKTFAPHDVVFEEGSFQQNIFFIRSGEVQIYHKDSNSTFIVLKKGNYFGEVGFFGNMFRTASVRCLDFVSLMCLEKKSFDRVAEMYPTAAQNAKLLERHCRKVDLLPLGIVCFCCRRPGHVAIQCRTTTIHAKIEETKQKWLRSRKPQSKRIHIDSPMLKRKVKRLPPNRFDMPWVKESRPTKQLSSASLLKSKIQMFLGRAQSDFQTSTSQHSCFSPSSSVFFTKTFESSLLGNSQTPTPCKSVEPMPEFDGALTEEDANLIAK